jgi:hypothetical protein
MPLNGIIPKSWAERNPNPYERLWNATCRGYSRIWGKFLKVCGNKARYGESGLEILEDVFNQVAEEVAESFIARPDLYPPNAIGIARLMKQNQLLGFQVDVLLETREKSIVRYTSCPLYDDPNKEVSDEACYANCAFERKLAEKANPKLKVEWKKVRDPNSGKYLYCEWCFEIVKEDIGESIPYNIVPEGRLIIIEKRPEEIIVDYHSQKLSLKTYEIELPKDVEELGLKFIEPYLAYKIVEHELLKQGISHDLAHKVAETHKQLYIMNYFNGQEQARLYKLLTNK